MKSYHLLIIEAVGVGISCGAFLVGLSDMADNLAISNGTIVTAVLGLIIAVGACAAYIAKEPRVWTE